MPKPRRRNILVGAAVAVSAVTATVVLSTGGPKTWSVSTAAALTTAEAQAQPGDTVNFAAGAVFHVPFVPRVSGTASAPITYTGAATFDAAGLTTTLAAISGRSYITVDGLSFVNSNDVAAPATNRGVIVRASNHISITHCQFSHMQMQLISADDNVISSNTFRYFVASYVTDASGVKQPQTAGDMLNVVLGSDRNSITGNDMKYAGHSLIEIGNGTGNTETNAANVVTGNVLSNPWYKDLILSDNGAGTVVDGNQIADANSVPTLTSTIAGQVGQLQTSSMAVQFSGENFTLSNNTISNAVCTYGCVSFGARWYYGAGAAAGGSLIESMSNQVFGNTLTNSKGAAAFSFEENYAASDLSVPRMTLNVIHGNAISLYTPSGASSWDHSNNYETVLVRSFKGAPTWTGLGGNQFFANTGVSATGAYRSSYVTAAGVTSLRIYSLTQFQASDPLNVRGNQ